MPDKESDAKQPERVQLTAGGYYLLNTPCGFGAGISVIGPRWRVKTWRECGRSRWQVQFNSCDGKIVERDGDEDHDIRAINAAAACLARLQKEDAAKKAKKQEPTNDEP